MKIQRFNENKTIITSPYIFLRCLDEDGEIQAEVLFDNEKDFGNYVLYNVNEIILEKFKYDKKNIPKDVELIVWIAVKEWYLVHEVVVKQ